MSNEAKKSQFLGRAPINQNNTTQTGSLTEHAQRGSSPPAQENGSYGNRVPNTPVSHTPPSLFTPNSNSILAPKRKITRDLSHVETVAMPSVPTTPQPPQQRITRDLSQVPPQQIPAMPSYPQQAPAYPPQQQYAPGMPPAQQQQYTPGMQPPPQQRRITRDLGQYPGAPTPMNGPYAGPGMGMNGAVQQQPPAQMAQPGQGPAWMQQAINKKKPRVSLKTRFKNMSPRTRILLVALVLLPSFLIIIEVVSALLIYNQAMSAVHHVTNVRTILTAKQGRLGPEQIKEAQQEMTAASDDFKGLRDKLQGDIALGTASFILPEQVSSLRALSNIGVEAMDIGQQAAKSLDVIGPVFQGNLLADDTKPLITPQIMDEIGKVLDYAGPKMKNIEVEARNIHPDSLPISDNQKDAIRTVLQAIPAISAEVSNSKELTAGLRWLLGVDQPRKILLQTLDRAEIRSTGGFTGQFAELTINGGRVGKIELQDIGLIEKGGANIPNYNVLPPDTYNWWPIANWGLRDSNLSADFPTSAKMAFETYKTDTYGKFEAEGLVVIAPTFIARLISAIGSIYVPKYNETITPENLEDRLHYYQLDNEGVRKAIEVNGLAKEWQAAEGSGENVVTLKARKFFTQEVAKLLMEKLRKVSPEQLVSLFREVFSDLKTKELQMYFSNTQMQQLITKYGSSNEIDRSDKHDGIFVVHSNINASKASTYVNTTTKDTVQLDDKGGATHTLQMKLAYTMAGPIRGLDTYRDFLRIYTPPDAKLLAGNGFEEPQSSSYCNGPTCNTDVYGGGELICPPLLADTKFRTGYRYGNKAGDPSNLNTIGPPSTINDENNRNAFGGWVIIPKNCTATISVTYYVPPKANQPYQLLVQRQGGTNDHLDLTILPPASMCDKYGALYYNGVMGTTDKMFTLPKVSGKQGSGCAPKLKA